jgi:hypothetical protein
MFMSDAGGGDDYTGANLLFGDGGAALLTDGAVTPAADYRPTSFEDTESAADFGNPPGGITHAGSTGANDFADTFGGDAPNGNWTLYVRDDAGNDTGSLAGFNVTVSTTSNDVVVNGTSGNDVISVVFTSANAGTYTLNGASVAFSGVSSFTVNGNAGDDALTITYSSEGPIPVAFNGGANGAGGDSLSFGGTFVPASAQLTYTGAASGTMTYNTGGPITFSGAEAINSTLSIDGLGIALPSSPDNVLFGDDGIVGNGVSRISSSTFSPFTFRHPNVLLNLDGASNDTLGINLADALNGQFAAGSLTNPALAFAAIGVGNVEAGTVLLGSVAGIFEAGDDPDADITAANIGLSAALGNVGGGNALETLAGRIESTASGGIAINNLSSVQIGQVSAELSGLSTSAGAINITALGSILLEDSTGGYTVTGGGNVNIQALGYGSNINAYGTPAVETGAGSIFLTAGQDIDLGFEVGNADLRANGGITLTAGRDIALRNNTDVLADDYSNETGGDVTLNAGRDVSISGTGDVHTRGGDINVTTGPGGLLAINQNSGGGGDFYTHFGDITLTADRMDIVGQSPYNTIYSVNPSLTEITLQTATVGRAIRIGSNTDTAPALELSDAELDRLSAGQVTIGSNSAGAITVVSTTSIDSDIGTLSVRTGGNITINSLLAATNALEFFAGGSMALGFGTIGGSSTTIRVDTPNTDTAGGSFTYATAPGAPLTITGNTDADYIMGGAAADRLAGGGGNDTLFGGEGRDRMTGGPGDDTYYVDFGKDRVVEVAGGGTDTIYSSVNYTLAAEVENLTLTGTAGIGKGNQLANLIVGNARHNRLEGGSGNDTLAGGAGNDTLIGGANSDVLRLGISGAGNDRAEGFNTAGDRFQLSGGAFTAAAIDGADTILTHNGGTIRMVGFNQTSLTFWNNLVLPGGESFGAALPFAAMAGPSDFYEGPAFAHFLPIPDGDWVYA